MAYDTSRAFEYENGFYLTAQHRRLGRLLAHYELFKRTLRLDGDVVECGVFRGASLMRFVMMQQLLAKARPRRVLGFDTFADFPATAHEPDREERAKFIEETGGGRSMPRVELEGYLRNKGFADFLLVEGDICQTVPRFVAENPDLRLSLLNLDTDVQEPARVVIEHLVPRVVPGGVIIFDDYGVFPGETRAADELCAAKGWTLRRLDFIEVPWFAVVGE